MRRKILIFIMIVLLFILGGIFIRQTYEDKTTSAHDELVSVLNDVSKLANKLNRYQIKPVGELAISANYKGAHGENFPHDFTFKYALKNDKIYFENEDGYNSLKINKDLINFIKNLTNKIDIDRVKLSNSSVKFNNVTVDIDTQYLNETYNTNFKNINATVSFENIISKNIDNTIIKIDDITITKIGESYTISTDEHNIKFNFNKNGYSLNINDNIKMNVFNESTNDRYTLVIGNYVYSCTVNSNGLDFVASTGASIYNSINFIATYGNYELKLENELDVEENPLTRYFSDVK